MIDQLAIEEKTNNNGVNSAGKLTALEFNRLKSKVNEIIDGVNKTVYVSQEEYDALLAAGEVVDDVEYNVYE